MQETRVQSLGWEDSLEKGMATHPSIFAWKIQWPEEPGGLQSMESQRARHNRMASLSLSEGWDGGVGRRLKRKGIYIYIYIYLTHFIVQQKLTRHCKAIIHQFKKISKFKYNKSHQRRSQVVKFISLKDLSKSLNTVIWKVIFNF